MQTHTTNGGTRSGVGDAGEFDVESADGEVSSLGGGRNKGLEGVGGGIELSGSESRSVSCSGMIDRRGSPQEETGAVISCRLEFGV